MTDVDTKELIKRPNINILEVLQSANIPKIYANGFMNIHGNSDMGIVLQLNGNPVAVVNLSFTLAKTLAEKLNEMIIDFEEATGTDILTTSVVDAKITRKGEEKK